MSKCDWCRWSVRNKDGQLTCPYTVCIMSTYELEYIIKQLSEK